MRRAAYHSGQVTHPLNKGVLSVLENVVKVPFEAIVRLEYPGLLLERLQFSIIMSRNMTAQEYKSGGRNFGGTVERRGNSRYPVREDVRYRVLQSKAVQMNGSGKTLNISSGGILFTTSERL